MFNPDLKELLGEVNSRYSLVKGVSARAREIQMDAIENETILDRKVVSMAIDDILNKKYIIEEPEELISKNK